MATLTPEAIDDLVETTYDRALKPKKWTDISLSDQFHCLAQRFLQGKKMPVSATPNMIWKLQVRNTETFRFTGLFSKDQHDVQNLAVGASQQWALATANWAYDVQEPEFQQDMYQIVDYILMREHSMYNDWWKGMEAAFWTAPTSSTQDPRPISGIPFWVQKNSTEGFKGGDPSGFSAGAGGVSTSTYPNWKNYTFPYSQINRDDFVEKAIKAMDLCEFTPPHEFPDAAPTANPKWSFYTTYAVRSPLWQYLDTRNDNLRDVAGTATTDPKLRNIPVKWVPALTNAGSSAVDTSNPFYGINWGCMDFRFKKGWDMKRTGPVKKDGQRHVRVVHIDSTCNLATDNRRAHFVGYVA